ncbi:MAG: hypothetical protein E6G92_04120 [Alphaproteobacteria bacterium]|nr:MAG: hypothetical protein E6G92_04120 [Alphaproteobacteria bacterium]
MIAARGANGTAGETPAADAAVLDADTILLIEAARAVLAGFRISFDAGRLQPSQHASLLLLENALVPFADNSSGPPLGGTVGDAPGCLDGQHGSPASALNGSAAA